MKKVFLLLIAGLLSSACIVKETKHTLYLLPDGEISWTVLETEVHAYSSVVEEQTAEETAFMNAVYDGEHGVAKALAILDPELLDCRVLREDRPFTVWTEARFSSIDTLMQNILDRAALPGCVELWTEGEQTHFELVCYPDKSMDATEDDEKLLSELIDEPDNYRLVLTEGRFIEAEGFSLQENGRVAVLLEPDEKDVVANEGAVVFKLSWITSGTR